MTEPACKVCPIVRLCVRADPAGVPSLLWILDVTAEPASTVGEPGVATSIAVEVNDAGGVPVEGANAFLIVVDEAVLVVSGYDLINPIDVFYRSQTARLHTARRKPKQP